MNNYIFIRHLLTHFPQIDFQFNNFRAIDGSMKDMLAQMLATIQKQNIDESQLDDLMMDTVVKHIGRNGIRFLKQIILMMHFTE